MSRRMLFGAGLIVAGWLAIPVSAEVEAVSFPLPEDLSPHERIRVAVVTGGSAVQLYTRSAYELESLESKARLGSGRRLDKTQVMPSAGGLRFGTRELQVSGLRLISRGAQIQVNEKDYREIIQIKKTGDGKILVVNDVGLEEYLRGVLPREMPANWPIEALKAQAVASRTFALFQSLSRRDRDYTLASDVIGQVYGGRAAEHWLTDRVIAQTRGEILTYAGDIFPAYFSSTCAGHTTHCEYNWDIHPHPSLSGVSCIYCLRSKHYGWKNSLPAAEVEKRLKRAGYRMGELRGLAPEEWDESGRARRIQVRHGMGTLAIRANDFRLAVGPDILRSTKGLRIESSGGQVTFSGVGWGHGVGMCQWGAKALAEQGKSYREILQFYYPGSSLTPLKKPKPLDWFGWLFK
ncbi:MAG: SpoIID/LytB domain-containing protein [Candidatus Omnitrophica bacterium]|nr:SpoIID/LytB domain-containing protein [Candidatus Omnitrophota bacterium]